MYHLSFMDRVGKAHEVVCAAENAEAARKQVQRHYDVAEWLFAVPVAFGTIFAVN